MRASTRNKLRPSILGAILLFAGVLQIFATVVLNLASVQQFQAATGERPTFYVLSVLIAMVGFGIARVLRRRFWLALALFVLCLAGDYFLLRPFTTKLGAAYHGEFLLHYFNGLLGLTLLWALVWRWHRSPQLGKYSSAPLIPAVIGGILLLASHVLSSDRVPLVHTPYWMGFGVFLTLASWPTALFAFWSRLHPPNLRGVSLILLIPLVTRILFAGPGALYEGTAVHEGATAVLGATMIFAAIGVTFLFRPRVDTWLRATIGVICIVATSMFLKLYTEDFGHIEGDLGPLSRSLFGFPLPYPQYVEEWKPIALGVAIVFILFTVYGALVSSHDRHRGIALGLFAVAGMGLSSPQLVLMLSAGSLLFLDSLLFDEKNLAGSVAPNDWESAFSRTEKEFERLAERLAFAAPARVDRDEGPMLALRGELNNVPLDLRLRSENRQVQLSATIGHPGRSAPPFRLIPDSGKRGLRPMHLLARSHRAHGDSRELETLDDSLLDALVPLPNTELKLWDAGAQVDFGDRNANADRLEALLRATTRILAS